MADEVASKQRAPGLQIAIVERSGEQPVAYQPPQMLDVTPVPEAVPAIQGVADAE